MVDKEKVKNILVVRNDRFGEFLLNIPALRALRQSFKNARITVVVKPEVKELIEDNPYVDEIIVDNFSRKIRFFGVLKIAAQLRRQRFNIAIMFNPSKIFNILSFLAMIPIRLGYNRKCAFFLTHRIEDKKYEGLKHEVDYNLELINLVGARTDIKDIVLPIRSEDLATIDKLLSGKINSEDKLIAIHPWASDPRKQWPLRNFIQLINLLTQEQNVKVIIVGGKENKDSISAEHFIYKEKIIDFTGELTLRQASCLFTKCVCLASCDSGPVHLAAASNLKTVALFRKEPPAISSTRWGPWGKDHTVIEKQSLGEIAVVEVLNKVKELL